MTKSAMPQVIPDHIAARPSRVYQAQVPPAPTSARPGFLFGVALTLGFLVGPAEILLQIAWKRMRDPSPGLFRMNRNILWTVPLFYVCLFALVGVVLAALARKWPQRAGRWAAHVFCFLTAFALLMTVRKVHGAALLVLALGVSRLLMRCVGRRIESPGARTHRLLRFALPISFLIGVIPPGIAAQNGWLAELRASTNPQTASKQAPNVLLIVLDTVRADRLSTYGHWRETTPNLTRLAAQGVRFDEARSTAPWTLPSHAGMMTGRSVHELSAGIDSPLDETFPTIAEHLAAHGYETAGFVANTNYCGAETGLARGFAHYEDHPIGPVAMIRGSALGDRLYGALQEIEPIRKLLPLPGLRKTAATINGSLLSWLETREDRPFFAFLNYFDAHSPYEPPRGATRRFGLVPSNPRERRIIRDWFVQDRAKLSERDHQLVADAYDDCLAYLDAELGKLFGALQQREVLDNTVVIVTADHGEAFGEHGLYGHAASLYRPEVHVPLIMRMPGRVPAGVVVSEPVSHRDLAATIVDLTGSEAASGFSGTSLARLWSGSSRVASAVLTEVEAPVHTPPNHGSSPVFRGSMRSLVDHEYIYILNGDGVEELYSLHGDREETRNLAADPAHAADLARMRARLAAHPQRNSGAASAAH